MVYKGVQCSEDDRRLFRRSVERIQSLPQSKTVLESLSDKRSHQNTSLAPINNESECTVIHQRDYYRYIGDADSPENSPVGGETLLEFSSSGIPEKTMKKLRSGAYPIDAYIDLHGQGCDEALEFLMQIFSQAQQQGQRCLKLIHGKGYSSKAKIPVLKKKLNHWLREQPSVLAFCSAPRHLGGAGALLVLIKRQSIR